MIKIGSLGMYDIAKIDPTLTSQNDVANYSFITVDGILYLVMNTITGDKAYIDDAVIPAGECLNGYQVDAWLGQKLVVDEKHIAYGSGVDFDDITAGTTLLTVANSGKLQIAQSAPQSGIYFKVTDKTVLTENAVKVKVMTA
jgi:hypothetical protein